MADETDLWEKVIADLRGTCQSLPQALEEHDAAHLEDDDKFLAHLDQEIFCCTACNWWCDQSEEASEDHGLDEWTCLDCCEEAA